MKYFLGVVLCLTLSLIAANASEPKVWSVNSRAEVLGGEARGVSITDTGAIVLAPRLTEIYDTQQSFVWSSAVDGAGNVYLGTGSDGKLFKVGADGKGALLNDFNELDVTALAIGKDNSLFAATSPDGKIYRVDGDGKAEVYFDPPDKYIWSLTVLNDGSLIVGTGENGKIYRVKNTNPNLDDALFFDSSETHIISLAVDKQDNLIAGTDANGIVLRIAPDGKAFALLDAPAPLREIHQISVTNDNSIYVLALSDTASSSSSPAAAAVANANVVTPSGATATATVTSATVVASVASDDTNSQQTPPRSRNDLTNTKSAVFRIKPDGSNEVLWSSTAVTAFSAIANPNNNGVLIGTSDKGRIYSITNEARDSLLLQTNQGQISSFKAQSNDVLATSSNNGKLYRFGAPAGNEGTYESIVRDAKNTALWGRIWWRSTGNVEFQTRTGNTERPDATWSPWSAPYRGVDGAQIASPKARFLQWRAVLRDSSSATAATPGNNALNNPSPSQNLAVLNEVSISYLPQNIAPEVTGIQILPSNVGLQSNIVLQTDPNIENSNLDPAAFNLLANQANASPPRRIYQRGARSLVWTGEDRNNDKIEYSVFYRSVDEREFRLLKDKINDNFFTIDGAALADGRYAFKVVASDAPTNPLGQNLMGERQTEVIEIDNTPPIITVIGAPQTISNRARVVFEAVDKSSLINQADMSIDGREWQRVYSDDGISDSKRERYTVEIQLPSGEHTLSLRVFDGNGNLTSFRVTVNL